MSTLLGYLSAFTDTKQPRVYSYSTSVQSTLTFKAVSKQAQALRNQYSRAAGAKVALTLTASAESLINLVALDGFVEELILLPVDQALPQGCHYHLTERGHLRMLNEFEGNALPVHTQWGLLDEQDHLIEYYLDDLASNELVATGDREDPLRWGVLQEPSELAGLLVWLRALRAGEDIVLAQADSLTALLDLFTQAEVTAIAAPPRLWRNFIATSEISRLSLRLAVVNGGIADAPTIERLQAIFPKALVVHSFSNTGVGISWLITDGKPGLPAELFASGENKVLLEIAEDNRLVIEFTGTGAAINTGYLTECDNSGRVIITGHIDNQVSVGGRQVQPEQVEQAILKVPGVSDVQASSMPNDVLGELIRVDVLAPDFRTVAARKELKKTLQEHCREHLEPWQRPARYYFY